MPKNVPLKEIKVWKRKYTEKGLKSHNKGELEKFCKGCNLPYKIAKYKIIENILLVQKGKKLKYLDNYRTWDEVSKQSEGLGYLRTRFAEEYVLATRHFTDQEWATRYHVAKATIALWKNDKNVRKLMEKISSNFQETFIKSAEKAAVEVLQGLKVIVGTVRIDAEIRRKAANDILDYAQKNKANVKGVNITQVQGVGVKVGESKEITDEERKQAEEEIKEAAELVMNDGWNSKEQEKVK